MRLSHAAAIATVVAVLVVFVALRSDQPPVAVVVEAGEIDVRTPGALEGSTQQGGADNSAADERTMVRDRPRFWLRVVAGGNPVGGAQCIAGNGVLSATAVTDAAGRAELQFPVEATGDCAVQVGTAIHPPAIRWLRAPWGRHIEVALSAGPGVIRGVVRRKPERPVPASLQVVAWPHAIADAASLVASGGGIRASLTAGGSFELTGLLPGRVYSVGVTAPGWTTRRVVDVEVPEPPAVAEVELIACRIYAAIVQVREVDGSMPPASTMADIGFSSDVAGLKAIHSGQSMIWALAGLLPQATRTDADRWWADWLIGFGGDTESQRARATIAYLVPGFVRTNAILDLSAVSGSLPVKRVTLQRLPGELLDVEIVCSHACGESGTRIHGRQPYELRFGDPAAGSDWTWRQYATHFASRTLRGVPAGEYDVSLVHVANGVTLRPQEGARVVFGRAQPNRLTFDTSGLATLRVVGADPSFDDEPRKIVVGNASYDFVVGPYVIGALMPGRQKVRCGTFEQEVDLVAGTTTTLTLADLR